MNYVFPLLPLILKSTIIFNYFSILFNTDHKIINFNKSEHSSNLYNPADQKYTGGLQHDYQTYTVYLSISLTG